MSAPTTDARATDRGHELADRARAGDRRALARLLTEVENRSRVAESALRRLYPVAGAAHLVGVTGAPGAGKSTLVAALVEAARRSRRAVAVLAIDPSSPITGGAILGDRVRMQQHAGDDDVFIRSMAARGHAGGLAGSTIAAAAVLDAAGFPLIFIETVGTGQSEVEVASIADTTLVVQAPEMGDEVQAIKAGLLEVADIVVVNKSDRPGAERTAAQLRGMLTVGAQHDRAMGDRPRPKRPEVRLASALTGAGVDELMTALDRRHDASAAPEQSPTARRRASAQAFSILDQRLRERLLQPGRRSAADAVVGAVATHEIDPYAGADRLLEIALDEETVMGPAADDPLVTRLVGAIAARDAAAFGDCYAPDAVLVEPLFPTPHRGRGEITAGEQALFDAFGEVEPEVLTIVAAGNRRAVELVMRATNTGPIRLDPETSLPATGRRIELPMAWLLELDQNGLIVSEHDYFDTTAMLRQLGLAD